MSLPSPPLDFGFPYNPPWTVQEDFMRSLYACLESSKTGIFESPTGTGKSLSIICGAMKWLRDHQNRPKEVKIQEIMDQMTLGKVTVEDDDEPDWVKQHEVTALKREAEGELERREAMRVRKMQRIKNIENELNGLHGRQAKKTKTTQNDNDDEEEQALLPDDYDSDDEDKKDEQEDEDEIDEDTRIFYCSRTHSQIKQFVQEFLKTPYSENARVVSLGARKSLCINEKVNRLKSPQLINDRCLELQKVFQQSSVKDIEDLVQLGKTRAVCPYYGSRNAIPSSEVITVPYNIILQKSSRESYKINLKNSVVIFAIKWFNFFPNRETAFTRRFKHQIHATLTYVGKTSDFLTATDFLHQLEMDNINLFKLSNYLVKSKIAYKIQSFADKVVDKVEDGVTSKGVPTLKELEKFILLLLNPTSNGRVGVTQEAGTIYVKYLLLNPLDVFQEIVTESRSVILAGGTMEPIGDFIDQLLSFVPEKDLHRFSCGHIVPPTSVLTMAVSSGPSGAALDFTYESRGKNSTLSNLMETVAGICKAVPSGIVCFVASYSFLEIFLNQLRREGSGETFAGKKIFTEPKVAADVTVALKGYTEAIQNPKYTGAIIFCVVGGKLSEGINFSDDLARAVIMVGLPFPNKHSPEFALRAKFMEDKKYCTTSELLENLCMRSLNQSIGRAIRHKNDYAAIYLLDRRFRGTRIKDKLPRWIRDAGVKDAGTFSEVLTETQTSNTPVTLLT
ncbi:helicase C-terminal domain-containing protein [Chytridium lagenaria]|nr:helicase C-terminal domain-containing protein [Chytridium lagenaria]